MTQFLELVQSYAEYMKLSGYLRGSVKPKYMLQWRRQHAYEKLKDALDYTILRVEMSGNKGKYSLYKI
jgi:hypothetical protein